LADGLDVFGVHLQDQQQLPLGHVHFAFVDREVAQFGPSAVEHWKRDLPEHLQDRLGVFFGLLEAHCEFEKWLFVKEL